MIRGLIATRKEQLTWLSIAVFYLSFVILLIFSTPHHVPPDEYFHLTLIRLYEGVWIPPIADSPLTYELGPVSAMPYAYHYLLSRFSLVFKGYSSFVLASRLASLVLYSTGLALLWRNLIRQQVSLFWRALYMLWWVALPSFVFMSSAVNYDALMFLCVAGWWSTFWQGIERPSLSTATSHWCWLGLGLLTKISFVPFAVATIAWTAWLPLSKYLGRSPLAYRSLTLSDGVRMTGAIVLAFACWGVYGQNLLRYGSINPNNRTVIGERLALQYDPQSRRDASMEADLRARQNDVAQTIQRPAISDFIKIFCATSWASMEGMAGHQAIWRRTPELKYARWGTLLLFLIATTLSLSTSRRGVAIASLGVGVGYLLILGFHNYQSVLRIGAIGPGIQGRYWIPALVGLGGVLPRGGISIFRRHSIGIQISYLLAAIGVLATTTYGVPTIAVNTHFRFFKEP